MHDSAETIRAGRRRAVWALVAAIGFAVLMTWPLAPHMGSVGRTGAAQSSNGWTGDNGDGLMSLWNVSWVARTIVVDPLNVFRANIFYPHKHALAYSEANLVSGVIGVPVWWTTKNPYATLNFVNLVAFTAAYFFAWLLVRHLSRDAASATIAAVFFAFCPYVFAHTPHVQLLWTGGLPLVMLTMHRVADAPSTRRGIALGCALCLQALACAYYGIFAALMVGFAVIFFTVSRSALRNVEWWKSIAVAAFVSILCVLPFFLPYIRIQQQGFGRTLDESVKYSANAASYLASSAHAHAWLLRIVSDWPRWTDVIFPGFGAISFGLAGAGLAAFGGRLARRERETSLLYGLLGILALWASFGPSAGLYTALYRSIPLFSFLRAPVRLAILVVLCLSVLAGFALRSLLERTGSMRRIATALLTAAALAELTVIPFPWGRALVPPAPYRVLAKLPEGPLAEFPYYGGRVAWHLHTQYMVFSTAHWMPLLNGYSDHTPPEFRPNAILLDDFPSKESFQILQRVRIRYIGVHWDMFGPRAEEIRVRLRPYLPYLRELASDERMTLYEVVGFP